MITTNQIAVAINVTTIAPIVKPIPAFTHWNSDGIVSSMRSGGIVDRGFVLSRMGKSVTEAMSSTVTLCEAVVNA